MLSNIYFMEQRQLHLHTYTVHLSTTDLYEHIYFCIMQLMQYMYHIRK
jgi:hypothetical protein